MKQLLKNILPEKLKQKIVIILEKIYKLNEKKIFGNVGGKYSYAVNKENIRHDTVIGSFCSISSNVYIAPGNHPITWLTSSPAPYNPVIASLYKERLGKEINQYNAKRKCVIGNDVWIGVNAIILQGITIGDGAIVGSNAVVTHDVPPYAIVAGVPAKIIRYRFDEEMIKDLLQIKWWNKPYSLLKQMSFNNPKEDIEFLKNYEEKVNNDLKICFIVTSVVYPSKNELNYSKIRSGFTIEERLEQTKQTVRSIRKKCPNAKIVLVDGGEKNPELDTIVDQFIYIGDNASVRKAVSSKYKGLGEAQILLEVIHRLEKSDYYFKVSGRYYLNDNFDLTNFDFDAYNFRNYSKRKIAMEENKYVNGSHSTRLYGIPGNCLFHFERGLQKSLSQLKLGKGIEYALPRDLRDEKFNYVDQLGISGYCGVDKVYIEE